jgi:hypothetical protein
MLVVVVGVTAIRLSHHWPCRGLQVSLVVVVVVGGVQQHGILPCAAAAVAVVPLLLLWQGRQGEPGAAACRRVRQCAARGVPQAAAWALLEGDGKLRHYYRLMREGVRCLVDCLGEDQPLLLLLCCRGVQGHALRNRHHQAGAVEGARLSHHRRS